MTLTIPAGQASTVKSTPSEPREYSVVAVSFPIVYSLEGDHDPNGMLYTLETYEPLLNWARRQWKDRDDYLPRMHRRRQLMEVVVDGIPRYERMREILADGPVVNHYLLDELGDEHEVFERETRDVARRQLSDHDRAVRQNYRTTLDELVTALRELSRGRITRLTTEIQVLHDWRRTWYQQLNDANQGIETQLQRINTTQNWSELFKDFRQKQKKSKLTNDEIQRLLLNDHSLDSNKIAALGKDAPAYDRFNPLRPIPVVRPLVLRACRGETVTVHFRNEILGRRVGLHVQGDGLGGDRWDEKTGQKEKGRGVRFGDGAHVGKNEPTTVEHRKDMVYYWTCDKEGVWPMNDLGDVRGTDRGTNAHGLFAALVVEPAGTSWYDPETGKRLDYTDHADGLYVDVVTQEESELKNAQEGQRHVQDGVRKWRSQELEPSESCVETQDGSSTNRHDCASNNRCKRWREENFVDFYSHHEAGPAEAKDCSFREFTVFFHDEPETHSGIPHALPHSAMPLSYRAEPMHNRVPYRLRRRHAEQQAPNRGPAPVDANGIDHSAVKIDLDDTLGEVFWVAKDKNGKFLERVSGEEQHHSSWLFGEPVTPMLRAYRGDPARVRLVHAGVKETHVFHLHVHQWRAVAQDTAKPSVWEEKEHHGSQLLDSISIGPQTGMTIDALYGSGSRQHAIGDIIWHCHLYPHFHHGMWGIWRSFDRQVTGKWAYPDGTPCPPLAPLPGRVPETSTEEKPGFPWFIDGTYPLKSPPPPAAKEEHMDGRRQLLKMDPYSPKEFAAFAEGCNDGSQPGALFVDLDGLARRWNNLAEVPERRIISYDIAMDQQQVEYNSRGWHDPMGHHYNLTGVEVTTLDDAGQPTALPRRFDPPPVNRDKDPEAFFPRANHGDIVELRLHNMVGALGGDRFDFPAHPVECGLHVHLVKFDVLAADGSATGWNYLSGAPSPGAIGPNPIGRPPRNVSRHRWVVDEEFGTCFFHDHLLANFRQKRGLFAALIAEPNGTRWYLPDQAKESRAWVGTQAVIKPRDKGRNGEERASALTEPFREAGLAIGDFVPLRRANGEPLNPPNLLGGDDDPGVMGVNYRCTPLEHRGKDPSEWFSSSRTTHARRGPLDVTDTSPHLPVPLKDSGDPDTPVIYTYPGERLRLRLFQGSHEEQHSFMLNGLRWRKDWHNPQSPLVNQQTLGISEAFTVDINPTDACPYGAGDYLWQFTVMDDLWLGCWGIIRALPVPTSLQDSRLRTFPRLSSTTPKATPIAADTFQRPDRSIPYPRPAKADREYIVVAQRHEHLYARHVITDPWGLIYRTAERLARVVIADGREMILADDHDEPDADWRDTGNRRAVKVNMSDDPLILRAHPGEWIKVTLINEVLLPKVNEVLLSQKRNAAGEWETSDVDDRFAVSEVHLPAFGPEVSPPRLPVEHRDHLGYPDRRTVSPRVSLHPSLLRYDVVNNDGAYVGHNHDSTVAALNIDEEAHVVHGGHDEADAVVHRTDHGIGHRDANWREYWWYVDEKLAPETADADTGATGQVCYLFDMADIRNHRHHGLIGALIIEPADITPVSPEDEAKEKWSGVHVHLRQTGNKKPIAQEFAVFLQDGLRHFLHGDIDQPMPDISPSDPPVDVGQKAINYRSPLTPGRDPLSTPGRKPLSGSDITAPVRDIVADLPISVRLVCAGDKPRNHTFTLHNFAWDPAPWVRNPDTTRSTGSTGAICAGFAQDLVLRLNEPEDTGDHAYRSGAFRWAVSQGMWGILHVKDSNQGNNNGNDNDPDVPR